MVAIGAALVVAFGANAAGAATKRPPEFRESSAVYFNADAYPPAALRAEEQGRVVARLEVDNTGKVVSCTVTKSSGSASLDQTTCKIALDRIVFNPATDRRGRPIASNYNLPVRWVLPAKSSDTPIIASFTLTERVVDRDGVVRSCTRRDGERQQQGPEGCDGFGPPAEGVTAKLPAFMQGHAFVVFTENRQDVEGLVSSPPLDSDLTVLFRIVEHFTVGTTGVATDCRIDAASTVTPPHPDTPCAPGKKFRLDDGELPAHPVHVTRFATVAVRPLPDAGGI